MINYISTIIDCEREDSDWPMITYLANGMSDYLELKIGPGNKLVLFARVQFLWTSCPNTDIPFLAACVFSGIR